MCQANAARVELRSPGLTRKRCAQLYDLEVVPEGQNTHTLGSIGSRWALSFSEINIPASGVVWRTFEIAVLSCP